MTDIDMIMRALGGVRIDGGDEAEESMPHVDAIVMELTERGDAMIAAAVGDFPFGVGDFVTGRPGSNLTGAGEPWRVIEIDAYAKPYMSEAGSVTSCAFGIRHQVRVLRWSKGHYVAFWHEAGVLIPWEKPAANVFDFGGAKPKE